MKPEHAILILMLALAIIIFAPFGVIWSLNTLFPLEIPYTGATWFAALLMLLFFGSKGGGNKN